MSRPARVAAMHAHADSLSVVFVTDAGEVPVTVALQPSTAHSLRHLRALHAHADGCHRSPSTQLHVDLLLRALRSVVVNSPAYTYASSESHLVV